MPPLILYNLYMDIRGYQFLANNLLAQHGLKARGWTIGLDNSVKRFGVCKSRTQAITLSRHLVTLNSVKQVTDTILHEIAHALAPRYSKHNEEWRRIALSIGCNGERCYNDSVITPTGKYSGTCPNCKRIITRHRKPKSLACGKCCKAYNNGRYSPDYQFIWG